MTNLPTIKNDINFNDIADVIGQSSVEGPSMAHSILKINRDLINLIPKTIWFKNIASPKPIGTANIKNINHLRLFQSEICQNQNTSDYHLYKTWWVSNVLLFTSFRRQ